MAAHIAPRLDQRLIEEARERIRRRLRQGPGQASAAERKSLHEWEMILRSMSLRRLRRFLVDEGPRATRLRQTFPFLDASRITGRGARLDRDSE